MDAKQHYGYEVAEEFAERVRVALGALVRAVHWFGSRVRGTASMDSDYDFVVETVGPLSRSDRDKILDVTIDLTAEKDCQLDVHYYTTDELLHSPYTQTPFVQSVLGNEVVL